MAAANGTGLQKAATGIEGFDRITGGGVPAGRTTVLLGASGTGKTVFALQYLVCSGREFREPGVFVAFEEDAEAIRTNARGFGWDLSAIESEGMLRLLDARLSPDTITSGSFDLTALLARVRETAQEIGARRVVFDAVDVLLGLMADPAAERSEVYRIRDWLAQEGFTGIVTTRTPLFSAFMAEQEEPLSFIQYMADCVVLLRQEVVERMALRTLRVLKYRGSGFGANEYPIVIGDRGLELAAFGPTSGRYPVFNERLSTGVERLDTMLAGGYYRATSVLITGAPGTAKSTLCGAFIDAACRRGERAMFVSFDESPGAITRNLESVGIHLQPHCDSGLLRIISARSEAHSADEHLIAMMSLVREHRPTCLAVDPISAMLKAGGTLPAHLASLELVEFAKSEGITIVCSSLSAKASYAEAEEAELRVSTIADTWIQLSFAVQGGERNRALTIVKSRGTAHSHQVRELVLSDRGISLADVYTAGGAVLMGTLRMEREANERLERERERAETQARRRALELSEARLQNQLVALQYQLEAERSELNALQNQAELRERAWTERNSRAKAHRRADVPSDNSGEGE